MCCVVEVPVQVALIVTLAAPLSSAGGPQGGPGDWRPQHGPPRAPLSGSTDSPAPGKSLMVAACLPSLLRYPQMGLSPREGLSSSWSWLLLTIAGSGRADLGKDPRSGREKGWRQALGMLCPEVGAEGEKVDEIFEREKSGW